MNIRRQRSEPFYWFLTALGGLILLFIVAPLIHMIMSSSGESLYETVNDTEVQKSIALTLGMSMAATLVCAFFAIPLAYILARKQFAFKNFINGIIDLPIVIPHSAAGIALLGIVARGSIIGELAEKAGIRFVGGSAGIAAAMAFVSVPFLINAARDGFAMVPQRLESVAKNLGASPLRVFATISVPLAWRSIVSGLVLMWARGMSEFGAVLIITYHPMITPILIYERFGAFGLKYARPVSVVFVIICLLFFLMFRLCAVKKNDN